MSRMEVRPDYSDEEIDIRDVIATIWDGKWIVFLAIFIFATAGIGYSLWSPEIYRSSVLVAPAQQESSSLRNLAGQFGGLASLAGINLGDSDSNQIVIAKEVLQSRAFLTDFFRRHELEVPLMGVERWNEATGEWIYDLDRYNPNSGEWLLDSDGESYKPSAWDLVKEFKENNLNVAESKESGLITISVKHYSPLAAQKWADLLVRDINEHMRNRDILEAEARIKYLEAKLDETNIAGMQQVFYQLIENETRTVMLANAQEEYVFQTIDPAVVPEEKTEPQRVLISVGASVLGAVIGVLIVVVRAITGNGKNEEELT